MFFGRKTARMIFKTKIILFLKNNYLYLLLILILSFVKSFKLNIYCGLLLNFEDTRLQDAYHSCRFI